MTPLPLNALRVFESVARLGSFRAAADELNVTQSAISHQIRHLEKWFGMSLFDRSGSRPKVLPVGQELAGAVGRSLNDMRSACLKARARQARANRLVIAAIPSVAVCWLIPRLPDFLKQHPRIATRVIYAFPGQTIDFSEVDLAFVYGDTMPQEVGTQAHFFLPGDSVPVCSPSVANAISSKQDFREQPEHLFLHDTHMLDWQTWFRRSGSEPPAFTGPVFEDFNLLRAAALTGQGIALCPEAMVMPDLQAGTLVKLSDIRVRENHHYYLVEPDLSEARMSAPVLAFHRWLRDSVPVQHMAKTL